MVFKDSDNSGEWMTTKEAADYLRISANALRILVHRKRIKPHKLGNRLRFKKIEMKSLIKEEN